MSKIGIGIVPGIVIVVALVIAISIPADESNDLELITIVANLPITGPGSGIGTENRDGLQLAVNELNSFGGFNGKTIELIVIDNETDLEKAKEIFLESEQNHNPLLHISSLSFISTGLGSLAEENKILLIALSAVAPEVTQDKEWVFRYFAMADEESIPILQILEKLNVNNLVIL
jgi:branched-chain amino acid transport system substrate-binding protein